MNMNDDCREHTAPSQTQILHTAPSLTQILHTAPSHKHKSLLIICCIFL
jgi:hypothetical protein